MTIDEIFDAMPAEAPADGRAYLIIDPQTRTITVPESETIFGVEADANAARKYFLCPRYVGDNLDLASMFLTVNYRNANGDEDGHLVNDLQITDDYVTFSWPLSPKAVAYKGAVQFAVCADLPNSSHRRGPDWNTTLAQGTVLEGLDPDRGDVEGETSDVVAQLRAEITDAAATVESEGAAQVHALRNAAKIEIAAAHAQIDAKGKATLATIPADYVEVASTVYQQANAIKGKLSGEIVQAGDVSPVEHYLAAKARGKNLFDASKIPIATPSVSYAYISEVSAGHIVVRTEEGYDGNGYCTVAKTLWEVCPALEVGKTYVLTADTESNSTNMYLPGIQKSWIFGKAMVMTEAVLNSAMTFYGLSAREGMGTGNCTISNIQIEEGAEATEYTPYIDPATVTVTRCGKNLFRGRTDYSETVNGVTFTVDSAGKCKISGTNTSSDWTYVYIALLESPAIKAGTTVTVSGVDSADSSYCVRLFTDKTTGNTIGGLQGDFYSAKTITLKEDTVIKNALLRVAGNATVNAEICLLIELGNTATAYEPYNGATAMPNTAGIITGLLSLAPTMTLLADTPGVTIECEYNRDSNAVYAELLAKIAALSGTT